MTLEGECSTEPSLARVGRAGVTASTARVPGGMDFTACAALARRQHGLVTRAQALTHVTEDQLKHALARRRLEPVRTGVYRTAGAPETWEQHQLAACLAGGPATATAFRAAAWCWRLEGYAVPDQLEVTVPRSRRARLPGVIVHDTRVWSDAHHTVHGGLPVTSPARTLCDLTACSGLGKVARALDDALRRRLTTLERLEVVFLDLATKGRRRSTFMRALLEERLPGFDPGETDAELKIYRWIVGAGLPEPVLQHRVRVRGRTYRIDLAYPDHKIGIEYDGWDAHRTRTSFDSDPERDAILEDAGWRMIHFTSKSSRAFVVEIVENALHQRSK